MTIESSWKDFITDFNVNSKKESAYNSLVSLLEYCDSTEGREEVDLYEPLPAGFRYQDLIIKFQEIILLKADSSFLPWTRVRYYLYVQEEDAVPMYFADYDYEYDGTLLDNFLILFK